MVIKKMTPTTNSCYNSMQYSIDQHSGRVIVCYFKPPTVKKQICPLEKICENLTWFLLLSLQIWIGKLAASV